MSSADAAIALPVVLLVFANDRYGAADSYLRNLVKERKLITDAFWRLDGQSVKVVVEPNATAENLFDLLDEHNDRLIGLHFAGHAGGHWLQLEDEHGRPQAINRDGLARRLGRLPRLQWIFLNGCATKPHVEAIRAACKAPVIATERAILDDVAMNLARRFYRGLCRGVPLQTAFEQAVDAVRARHDEADDVRRDAGAEGEGPTRMGRRKGDREGRGDVWPWTFHVHPDVAARSEWTLPLGSAHRPRRRPLVLGIAAALLVTGLVAAFVGDRVARHAPLAVDDVRVDGVGLSVRLSGVEAEEAVDGHLQVTCDDRAPFRVDLVPATSDNPARRRFEPVLGVHRMVMPSQRCVTGLHLAVGDQTIEAPLPREQSAPERRVLVFKPAGADEAFDRFIQPFATAARTVGRVVYSAVEGDIPLYTLPAPEGRTLERETAARLAEAGQLVQLVWPDTGHAQRVAGEVFMPAGDPARKPDAEGRRGDPLFRVEHLSTDPELSFDVTNELHALLMLIALADDARSDRTDIRARYLGEAFEHAASLLEAIGSLDPETLARHDRRVAETLKDTVSTIRDGVQTRLAALDPGEQP